MEKRSIDFTDPQLFAISAGLGIMVVPCFYWLGILCAMLFEKGIIVKQFLLPVTPNDSLGDVFILVGLPVIALLINIRARLIERSVKRRLNLLQYALMLLAIVSLIGAFSLPSLTRLHVFSYLYA